MGAGLSVVGSTSSWLFGKVAETASVAANAVASRQAGRSNDRLPGGEDSTFTNDISDLLSGGSGQRGGDASLADTTQHKDAWKDTSDEKDPSDLSDLLTNASLDPPAPRAPLSAAATPPPADKTGDFFGDENWGSGGGQDWGSDGKLVAPVVNVRPAGGGSLASRSKKVCRGGVRAEKGWW